MKRFICLFIALMALVAIRAEGAEEQAVAQAIEQAQVCECEAAEKNCPCLAQEDDAQEYIVTTHIEYRPVVVRKVTLVYKAKKAKQVAKVTAKKLVHVQHKIAIAKKQAVVATKKAIFLTKVASKLKTQLVAAKATAKALKKVIIAMPKPVIVLPPMVVKKLKARAAVKIVHEQKKLVNLVKAKHILTVKINRAPAIKKPILIHKKKVICNRIAVVKGNIAAQRKFNKIVIKVKAPIVPRVVYKHKPMPRLAISPRSFYTRHRVHVKPAIRVAFKPAIRPIPKVVIKKAAKVISKIVHKAMVMPKAKVQLKKIAKVLVHQVIKAKIMIPKCQFKIRVLTKKIVVAPPKIKPILVHKKVVLQKKIVLLKKNAMVAKKLLTFIPKPVVIKAKIAVKPKLVARLAISPRKYYTGVRRHYVVKPAIHRPAISPRSFYMRHRVHVKPAIRVAFKPTIRPIPKVVIKKAAKVIIKTVRKAMVMPKAKVQLRSWFPSSNLRSESSPRRSWSPHPRSSRSSFTRRSCSRRRSWSSRGTPWLPRNSSPSSPSQWSSRPRSRSGPSLSLAWPLARASTIPASTATMW
jgi:hypothetical protein